MWFIWNKTAFGKNMFAVGSNADAAKVSGVNVFWTTVMVHTLAGAMYGVTGFIEGARISSITQGAGLNYECDAIAACVIGGVSFVGGTGKVSGIVLACSCCVSSSWRCPARHRPVHAVHHQGRHHPCGLLCWICASTLTKK